MIDIRPVGYVIGWLVAVLGGSMIFPMLADFMSGGAGASVFAACGILTGVTGILLALACSEGRSAGLSVQQSFLMATSLWLVFPFFAALPFYLGAPGASATDAMFEAMSALTTTGSSVFSDLEHLPPGTLLWRGMLQWFGGLGIVVVAMIFLPALRIGGMQIFRSEAFETLGKILPKVGEIAASLTLIYVTLTFLCLMGYVWSGMSVFDALVHAMTTLATGGMANTDASFGTYSPASQYVAVVFMILAALPFIRYIQFVAGSPKPLWRDSQIRAFLMVVTAVAVVLAVTIAPFHAESPEAAFRHALFNVVSIITGTGFASTDYSLWGPLAATIFFVIGLIGGCSSSTTCSVKIFRYQILMSAVAAEVRRLHSPNSIFVPRFEGQPISDEVMNAVMAFFLFFFLTLGIAAVALVLIGLEPVTAISGAAAALANIGPGLGPEIGPVGNFGGLPDAAKWVLMMAMVLGRLELLTVLVLLTPAFWRA
jgi:trk system potassium uptake protein TrkH